MVLNAVQNIVCYKLLVSDQMIPDCKLNRCDVSLVL